MKNMFIASVVMASAMPVMAADQCTVDRIYTADKMVVNCSTGPRIIELSCVDSPEMAQGTWGNASRNFLAQKLGGTWNKVMYGGVEVLRPTTPVKINVVSYQYIPYPMYEIGWIYVPGSTTPLNYILTKNGKATVNPNTCKLSNVTTSEYNLRSNAISAEFFAKSNAVGVWSKPNLPDLQQTPWTYNASK